MPAVEYDDDPDDILDLLALAGVSSRERAWRRRAACRGHDTNAFFPPRGEQLGDVRAVCEGCPVRVECLDYALHTPNMDQGVWGGTSGRDRRRAHSRGWDAEQLLAELGAG